MRDKMGKPVGAVAIVLAVVAVLGVVGWLGYYYMVKPPYDTTPVPQTYIMKDGKMVMNPEFIKAQQEAARKKGKSPAAMFREGGPVRGFRP